MSTVRYETDPGSPLSTRQEQALAAFFQTKRRPISLVVFEDGQSPSLLLDYVVDLRAVSRPGQDKKPIAGVLYNLTAYTGHAVGLIEKLQSLSDTPSVAVLHAGSSVLADDFIDLVAHLCQERFETGPEVVLLFDRVDLESSKQPIRDYFSDDDVLDLTFWHRKDNESEMMEIMQKHMNLPGFPW